MYSDCAWQQDPFGFGKAGFQAAFVSWNKLRVLANISKIFMLKSLAVSCGDSGVSHIAIGAIAARVGKCLFCHTTQPGFPAGVGNMGCGFSK
jgi:hypothetical protein